LRNSTPRRTAAWISFSLSFVFFWETAIWAVLADRRIVKRPEGWRLIPAADVKPGDAVIPNDLKPCRVKVRDDGQFDFELAQEKTGFWIFDRGDAAAYQSACREAFPALYKSFSSVPAGGR